MFQWPTFQGFVKVLHQLGCSCLKCYRFASSSKCGTRGCGCPAIVNFHLLCNDGDTLASLGRLEQASLSAKVRVPLSFSKLCGIRVSAGPNEPSTACPVMGYKEDLSVSESHAPMPSQALTPGTTPSQLYSCSPGPQEGGWGHLTASQGWGCVDEATRNTFFQVHNRYFANITLKNH